MARHLEEQSKEQIVPLLVKAGMVLGGKLRLESVLGRGGMGSVWRARHLLLDTDVAVKVMATAVQTSDNARKRFEREARASLVLKSPHVVQVLDYGIEQDTPYIVMELLDGEDLAQRLARVKRLSIAELCTFLEPICKALRRAHELGLVHRDLKPSNIFLSKHGDEEFIKVLDFGIAKFLDIAILSSLPSMTNSGELLGSPLYMSPEQVREAKQIDHRSDLWSLGVIAYEALTGRSPFTCSQLGALLVAICTEPIAPPSELVPELGAEVDAFFAKALARDVAARFQSAQEFFAAFSALADPQRAERRLLMPSNPGIAPPPLSVDPHGTTLPTNETPSVPIAAPAEEALKKPAAEPLRETAASVAPSAATFSRTRPGKLPAKRLGPALSLLGLVVVGGIGLAKLSGPDATATAGSANSSTMAPSAASDAAPRPAPNVQTASLAVDPPDAVVLVDDVPVSVQNGAVMVTGEVGTSHVVRLRKGAQEMTSKVAITGSGIVPEKLTLLMPAEPNASPTESAEPEAHAAPQAKASRPAGATSTPPAATPPATATAIPSAKTKDPDFLRRFP